MKDQRCWPRSISPPLYPSIYLWFQTLLAYCPSFFLVPYLFLFKASLLSWNLNLFFSSPQGRNRSQRTHSRWQQRQHHHLYPDLGPLAGWLRQQIASWTRRYDKCAHAFPPSLSPVSTCWPYRWLADGACFSSVCLSYLHFLAHKSHTSEIHDRLCFGTVKLLIFSWHCNVYQ